MLSTRRPGRYWTAMLGIPTVAENVPTGSLLAAFGDNARFDPVELNGMVWSRWRG